MPKTVDFENLEQNIYGAFRATLERFGYDPDAIEDLQKIRHNAFETVLITIYEKLFKPEKYNPQNICNSLLPYNWDDSNIYILYTLVDVYIKLCSICGKSNGITGFCSLTGYSHPIIERWSGDPLNPSLVSIMQKLVKTNQHVLTNRLQDTPLGSVAVANNDKETGLEWSRNNAQAITKNTVFVLPGEAVRESLQNTTKAMIGRADD